MAVNFTDCGTTVLKPKSMAHIVFKTPNADTFKEMVAFYKTFLNATASYENELLSFLTYDEEHHRVAIGIFPGTTPRSPQAAGLAHVAFTFGSLQDLVLAYCQRKAHGILPFWCINHGPTMSMYYRDPDGNEIETQVDNFDTVEEADEFMKGENFAENPIGTEFEPEKLIQSLSRGEDEKRLKMRVEIGARREILA